VIDPVSIIEEVLVGRSSPLALGAVQ
jgi:hypothetical protein